jgi:hypothetical protein
LESERLGLASDSRELCDLKTFFNNQIVVQGCIVTFTEVLMMYRS